MSTQEDGIPPKINTELISDTQETEPSDSNTRVVNEKELQIQNEIETKRSSLDGKRITAQRYLRDGSEDEHATRKREREGSLEPSGSQGDENSGTAPPLSDGVPTKKNRLGDEEDNHSLTNQDSQAERVGHIRQRVQDLTWQEQKEREKELEKTQGKAILGSEQNNTASSSTSDILESPTKKQKQPTFASFSSSSSSPFASTKAPTSNIFASSTSDSSSTSISNPSSTTATNTSMKDVFSPKSLTAQPSSPSSKSSNTSMEDATPIPAPAKLSNTSTQPTFSSFSSTSSSPFNSKSPVAGPSWLGSNSNSKPTSAFGGIKPSSLGSSISTSNADQSKSSSSIFASNSTSTSSPATNSKSKAKASPALGFGAFAGSSPFASAKSSTGLSSPNLSGSSSPALQSGDPSEEKKPQATDEGLNKSETEDAFSQVLSQKDDSGNQTETAFGEEAASQGDGNGLSGNKGKGKETAMTDLTTGEESERTVHSARAKLYVMSSDANNSWKERGVGTIRCNVPKISMLDRSSGSKGDQKKGARLVMRADGVFRVILNVALFAGMSLELAQDKFVRIVALENGELVHFAIKLSNAAAANAFSSAVSAHIPSKDKSQLGDEIA